MNTMNDIEIYHDARTEEQWAQVTRVIPRGFICIELGDNSSRVKIGDGTKTYSQLPYIGGDMAQYYTKTDVNTLLEGYAKNSDLKPVAFSGSYNDLTDAPDIEGTLGDIQTALAAIVEVTE